MFVVIVQETKPLEGASPTNESVIERYRQEVDSLDLPALIATVNRKRRAPRTPKVAKP